MASSGGVSAGKGGAGSVSNPANNVDGLSSPKRRPSQTGNGQFSGLMNQKRNSLDATAQARRQSFNEQKPAAGIIGSMWSKFTTGHQDK